MNRYDGEIGRGRRAGNDSSSSRESSPDRSVPKRSFTPTGSDDESIPVQPSMDTSSAKENSPTNPTSQPVLREPVAFRTDNPPESIVTYEATPPPAETGKSTVYLPGQHVPAPKKGKKAASKRPRRQDAYPGQTSRFRIATYDPTPSTEPPIDHGTGPYSSMYRGVVANPQARGARQDSPATMSTVSTSNGVYPSSSAGSSHHLSESTSQFQPPSIPQNLSYFNPLISMGQSLSQQQQQQSGMGMVQGGPPVPPVNNNYPTPEQMMHSHPPPPPHPGPHSIQGGYYSYTQAPPPPGEIGPYYRRDYDSGQWVEDIFPKEKDNRRSSQPRKSGSSSKNDQEKDDKRPKYPLRMVTILIQDVRSGMTDHQLAEVKVPLRPGDRGEDGFWADARDISEQLQSGPCRIDGPARAYTLRGKYRQFLLRVNAQNEDDMVSTNVYVQPERTLDLIVETLLPPGAPPPPPSIPIELYGPQYDEYDIDHMDYEPRRDSREEREVKERRDWERGRDKRLMEKRSRERRSPDGRSRERRPREDRSRERRSRERGRRSRERERRGTSHDRRSLSAEREQKDRDRDPRKRMNTPSFDDYDGPEPVTGLPHPVASKLARRDHDYEHSPRQSPRHRSPRSPTLSVQEVGPPRKRKASARETMAIQQQSRMVIHRNEVSPVSPPPRPPPSPPPQNILYTSDVKQKEPKSILEAGFFKEFSDYLAEQEQRALGDFFRARGGNRVCDVHAQYKYIKKLFDTYVGKKLDKYAHKAITEEDVIKIMKLDDQPDWLEDYRETMKLLPLYHGEKDQHPTRYEDPRLEELLGDTKSQPPSYEPRKVLLSMLKRLDDAFTNGSRNDRVPSTHTRTLPGPGPPSRSSGSHQSQSHDSRSPGESAPGRGTKGMFV